MACCNNNSNYAQILISNVIHSCKDQENESLQRESEGGFVQDIMLNYQDEEKISKNSK